MNSPKGSTMEDVLNIISTLSLNILSFYVKIKFHTENEPPSLLDYGYSYEEALKIGIWKTTST